MTQDREVGAREPRSTVTLTAEVEVPVSLDEEDPQHRFALVVYSGNATEVVRLRPGSHLVVGRDFPSNVHIDDRSVSRQHTRFSLHDGIVSMEDLGSRNGTRVNGQRVPSATLNVGDEVRIGSARIALAMTRPRADPSIATSTAVVLRNERVVATYVLAQRAARTDLPVLVTGETGTGKEHLARTIHEESARNRGPWRAINCGALPASLIESALFGHERGAFTGADRRSDGLFAQAERGTLFLDEVAELPQAAQSALLRVLETKTYQRVGSSQQLRADVRIVAATHCDLEAAVAEGAFRKDLLYRINAVTLELPPLRERRDEIEALVERFVADCARQWGVPVDGVEPEAIEQLRSYDWPGNIRQLRNAIERAALVTPARRIRSEDLPIYVRATRSETLAQAPPQFDLAAPPTEGLKPILRAFESHVIEGALRSTGGNRTAAAKLLRVPLRTLFRRLNELGLTEAGLPDNPA